jgi:APA family basic amino acid/polyamine antiporter
VDHWLGLLLEYGVGAASVAHGWSHYFADFVSVFGIKLRPES